MGTQCSAGARESEIAQVDLAALMGTQSSTKAIENMVGSAALMGTQNPAKVAEKVGGRLSMLAWCAEEIKSIGEDGWEEIEFAVDSGASETVVGPNMIFSTETKELRTAGGEFVMKLRMTSR